MNTIAPTTAFTQKRKSVALTSTEIEKLKIFESRYSTQEERAKALGVDRGSLIRISQFGSGSEQNIEKIKQKIKHVKIPIVEQK